MDYIRKRVITGLIAGGCLLTAASGAGWSYSTVYRPVNTTEGFFTTASGLDVLENDDFGPLLGKSVAIVTNHTSLNRRGIHILDLISQVEGIKVQVIFGPEHGVLGNIDRGKSVKDSTDPSTGAKIFSLYGSNRKPLPDQLEGVDICIFDMQDVGARYYTYVSTMTMVMDACARDGIPFMVLDRPNPVRGDIIDGPVMDSTYTSFVGMHPVPIRHGLTIGELAVMINEEGWLPRGRRAQLTVVPLVEWFRYQDYGKTGLKWIAPSPNIPTQETALVYLGTCLFEGTNVSEGRGTYQPFHVIGAPWITGDLLARQLTMFDLPGVEFEGITFTPRSIKGMAEDPKYQDEECGGIRIVVKDSTLYEPIYTAAVIMHIIRESYPQHFIFLQNNFIDKLWGSDFLRRFISYGRNIRKLPTFYREDVQQFYSRRKPYLIYPVQ